MRRETPGPLSSIDMVPDEGRNDVQWALDELNKRQRTQADILFDLNDRLAVHGIGPISRSAFNRVAVRKYVQRRRREELEQVSRHYSEELKDRPLTNLDKMIIELHKTLVIEVAEMLQGSADVKATKELSTAVVNNLKAQALSLDINERIQKEFAAKTNAAIDNVVKTRGLSLETARDIRAQILGIKEAA